MSITDRGGGYSSGIRGDLVWVRVLCRQKVSSIYCLNMIIEGTFEFDMEN